MAESGCLHNEKFNNVNVDNQYKTGKYRADKVVYINTPISTQDNGDRNFASLYDGEIFELFKITNTLDTAPESGMDIEITWPEKTLIKNIALMFVDQNGNNDYIISPDRKLQVALNTKKDDVIPATPSIVTYKDIVDSTGVNGNTLIANSTPFSIIKNFTGIHANTLVSHAPALNFNNEAFLQPDFNILDGDDSNSWTSSSGSYPLYNLGDQARDKIVIQIKLINSGGSDAPLTSNQTGSFKIFAICEFLKMENDF